jgi:hypothetical protein
MYKLHGRFACLYRVYYTLEATASHDVSYFIVSITLFLYTWLDKYVKRTDPFIQISDAENAFSTTSGGS